MAKSIHIHVHQNRAAVRDAGDDKKGRWVTMSPSGTRVKLDNNGEITAGPSGMAGKKVSELSKGKQSSPAPKKESTGGSVLRKGPQRLNQATGVPQHILASEARKSLGLPEPKKSRSAPSTPAPSKTNEPSTQQVAKHSGKKVQPSKPGWALRADPELAAKFEAAEARSKAKKLEKETGPAPTGSYSPKGAPAKPTTVARQEMLREMGSPRYTGKGGSVSQKNQARSMSFEQMLAHPEARRDINAFEEYESQIREKASRGATDPSLEELRDMKQAEIKEKWGYDIGEPKSTSKPGPDGKPMGIHPALAAVTPPGFPVPGSREGNKVRVNQATGELSQVGRTAPKPTPAAKKPVTNSELAQLAHKAYIAATSQGNGVMARHYLEQYERHKRLAAKERK